MVHEGAPGDLTRGTSNSRRDEVLVSLTERAREGSKSESRLRGLLEATQTLMEDLDRTTVLNRVVHVACDLVEARYGALGVLAPDSGEFEEFVYVGVDEATAASMGRLPAGGGLLGALIDDPRPIRLQHLSEDARSVGLPDGHPPMDSFLGVPVRAHGRVLGNLYLADAARGHFTADDEALVDALAVTAGLAIHNARLYEQSQGRQRWLDASAKVTRQVLSGSPHDALGAIVQTVHRLAGADLACVLLPEEDESELTVAAAASGTQVDVREGDRFPRAGTLSARVLSSGEPTVVEDATEDTSEGSHAAEHSIGPAMLLPLTGASAVRGVLVVSRLRGARRFTAEDCETAMAFATHASLALDVADARRTEERMLLFEERARIARDLHDHAIQQLFAAGMTVQGVAMALEGGAEVALLGRVVDTIDEIVKQIRTSIFQLRPHTLGGRGLRRAVLDTASSITAALGFQPQVVFEGPVDTVGDEPVIDDVVAVVREALSNSARHAAASQAQVRVRASASFLEVSVSDDGVGIAQVVHRSGLANLSSRAQARGGRLQVNEPRPPVGTTVVWSVPLS